MAVEKGNKRIHQICLDKDVSDAAKKAAKNDNRSLSGYVNNVLKDKLIGSKKGK